MQTRSQFLRGLLGGSLCSGRLARADHSREPKIDAWTHILPKGYLDRLQALPPGPLTPLITFLSGIPALYDLEVRFRVMDGFDNYRQILTPVPSIHNGIALAIPQLAADLVRLTNDAIAEIVLRSPDRFAGFAGLLPMWDPEAAVLEVDRLLALRATGVQIEASVNGLPLDDARHEPLFAKLAENRRPVWIHPARTAVWTDYPTERASRYGLWQVLGWPHETGLCLSRLVLAGHLERYPSLRIIAHHGGGTIPQLSGRLGRNLAYVGQQLEPELGAAIRGLSRPVLDYFRMFYVDTACFGAPHAVRSAVEFFGADHVLFGTDCPFDPEQGPGFIRDAISDIEDLRVSGPIRRQIYRENATQLFASE